MSVRAVALILLGTLLGTCLSAKTPKMKWSEDKENVYLRLAVKDAQDVKVSITEDKFSFEATSNGEKYAVAFEIREDIDANASKHATKNQEFAVTLVKKHGHFWDRLATDPKPLKGFLTKDHGNVGGQVGITKFTIGDIADVEDEVEEDKHMELIRDEASFDALISKADTAVVEFFQPWCTHCQDFPPTMSKAAKKFAKQAKFARVDAREARTLGRRFSVGCNYTCTYSIFKKNEPLSSVKQEMKLDEMAKLLKPYMGPSIKPVEAGKAAKFAGKSRLALVGVFSSKDSGEYKAFFASSISTLRKDVSFGAIIGASDAEIGSAPAMKLFRKFDVEVDGGKLSYAGEFTNNSIVEWLQKEQHPLLVDFVWDRKKELEDSKKPMGQLFLDLPAPHEEKDKAKERAAEPVKKLVTKIAAEFKGKLRVLVCSTSQHGYMMEDLGLEKGAVPSFGVDDFKTGRKYALPATGADLTEGALRQWLQSVLDGTATPTYKSEPIPPSIEMPADWNEDEDGEWEAPEHVQKVVQKSFESEVEKATTDVLLELHTDWGAKHKELVPRLENVAKTLNKQVKVVRYDTTKNAELSQMYGDDWKYDKHADYSLYFIQKGAIKTPLKYESSKDAPTSEQVLEFMHEHAQPKFDLEAAKKAVSELEKPKEEKKATESENKAEL